MSRVRRFLVSASGAIAGTHLGLTAYTVMLPSSNGPANVQRIDKAESEANATPALERIAHRVTKMYRGRTQVAGYAKDCESCVATVGIKLIQPLPLPSIVLTCLLLHVVALVIFSQYG